MRWSDSNYNLFSSRSNTWWIIINLLLHNPKISIKWRIWLRPKQSKFHSIPDTLKLDLFDIEAVFFFAVMQSNNFFIGIFTKWKYNVETFVAPAVNWEQLFGWSGKMAINIRKRWWKICEIIAATMTTIAMEMATLTNDWRDQQLQNQIDRKPKEKQVNSVRPFVSWVFRFLNFNICFWRNKFQFNNALK